jgi:hypothetical protein
LPFSVAIGAIMKKTIDSLCGTASLDQWRRDSWRYASA